MERFYRDLARALGLLHGRVEFGVRMPVHLDRDSVVGVDQGADGLDAALRDIDGAIALMKSGQCGKVTLTPG